MVQFFSAARKALATGVAALIGLVACNSSNAQVAKTPKEPQATSNHQLAEARHLLQSIKLTLEKADHDYGGHRANAIRDINKAEKQLHEAIQSTHKKNSNPGPKKGGTGTGKGTAPAEPQKLSDAQLAAAVPQLNAVVQFLNKADHDYGGHRANAVTDVKAAVVQIEKALAFSAAKNQNKP